MKKPGPIFENISRPEEDKGLSPEQEEIVGGFELAQKDMLDTAILRAEGFDFRENREEYEKAKVWLEEKREEINELLENSPETSSRIQEILREIPEGKYVGYKEIAQIILENLEPEEIEYKDRNMVQGTAAKILHIDDGEAAEWLASNSKEMGRFLDGENKELAKEYRAVRRMLKRGEMERAARTIINALGLEYTYEGERPSIAA